MSRYSKESLRRMMRTTTTTKTTTTAKPAASNARYFRSVLRNNDILAFTNGRRVYSSFNRSLSSSSSSSSSKSSGAAFAGAAATATMMMAYFMPSSSWSSSSSLARCEEAKKEEKMSSSKGMPFESVTLYQYDVCPFCNKVKAFLDYHNIPYDVVEVNPLTKTEIKQFEHEWKKVPVLVVDGKATYNSRDIIKDVDERVRKHSGLTKRWFGEKSKKEKEKEEEWCKWVDDRFVHVLTPNIYKTFREAMESFDYITERGNFGFFERQSARITGAVSMYGISKMVLKKRHGIEDERASLFEETRKWMSEGVEQSGGKFCGGDAPNIADISMFGVFRAVKTFQTFEDVCKEVPEMVPWYERMQKAVGESSRSDGLSN